MLQLYEKESHLPKMWGFDSFRGLPAEDTSDVQQSNWKPGAYKASKTQIEMIMLCGPEMRELSVGTELGGFGAGVSQRE